MSKRFWSLLGLSDQASSADTQYDPVYGLPLRAVDEWLARNPRLRKRSPTKLQTIEPTDGVATALTPLTREKPGIS